MRCRPSRTYASDATLALGVMPNGQNVGGARAATQQRLSRTAWPPSDNTISVDGMKMNTTRRRRRDHPQHNEAMIAGSHDADRVAWRRGLGRRAVLNLIPKEGGNSSQRLELRRLQRRLVPERQPDAGAEGAGADVRRRDRLRLRLQPDARRTAHARSALVLRLVPARRQREHRRQQLLSTTGSRRSTTSWSRTITLRLTSQLTPRNKVTRYIDRAFKDVGLRRSPPATTSRPPSASSRGALLHRRRQVDVARSPTSCCSKAASALSSTPIAFTYQPGIAQGRAARPSGTRRARVRTSSCGR